jgi:hypothetical protein
MNTIDHTRTHDPAVLPYRTRRPHPAPDACSIARQLLDQPRMPGSDYYPCDDEILAAWAQIRSHCLSANADAHDHLEHFVSTHLDTLSDLMQRAWMGRAPTSFLNDLKGALAVAPTRSGPDGACT